MAIPLIATAAAAAAAKTAGGLIGGMGQYNDTQRGATAYRNLANQGIGALKQGKQESNAAFAPYQEAGVQGASGAAAANAGYKNEALSGMADTNATRTTAQGTQAYLDPSAAYSTDQARRSLQASALAKGGVGGGLARAVARDAQDRAMTNWNNAFQQQATANQQNFGQANQNWQNKNTVLQNNVGNYQNLMNAGIQGTQANQQIQAGYNTNINQNYMNQGDATQGAWNSKGKIFNDTMTGLGNNIGGVITSLWG